MTLFCMALQFLQPHQQKERPLRTLRQNTLNRQALHYSDATATAEQAISRGNRRTFSLFSGSLDAAKQSATLPVQPSGRGSIGAGRHHSVGQRRVPADVFDGKRFRAMKSQHTVWLLLAATGLGHSLHPSLIASDWMQWRGPTHNNVAADGQSPVTQWDSRRNVVWKTEIPGRGHSSPTITGNLIVLTSADESSETQAVIGFDRTSGKQLWLTPVNQGGFPPVHPKNTHASSTVATNGKLCIAAFHHHNQVEAVAVDRAGKIAWRTIVGAFRPQQYRYGYAASPTIYNDTVIISGDSDSGAWVKALNINSGNVVWERKRPSKLNWSSPIVANVAGRQQLLISGCDMMASYDPASGQEYWSVPCLTMATCGTVIFEDGVAFASGGYPKNETVAVAADGSRKILWSNNVKCYEQSMLVHNGYVYAFSDSGVVYCWNARTGQEQWKHRLRGPVSTSPVLVGDVIYAANERGDFYVFRANPQRFDSVAQNKLGTEVFATPAFVDDRIFVRVADSSAGPRQEYLYCLGAP
jgi:outer membrane protein assembly factor BamB